MRRGDEIFAIKLSFLTMKTIDEISTFITEGRFELSRHAIANMFERNISEREMKEAFRGVELIEDYPDDRYLPSCLLFGMTKKQRPLHIVITRQERQDGCLFVITVYQPDEQKWAFDWKTRL